METKQEKITDIVNISVFLIIVFIIILNKWGIIN